MYIHDTFVYEIAHLREIDKINPETSTPKACSSLFLLSWL